MLYLQHSWRVKVHPAAPLLAAVSIWEHSGLCYFLISALFILRHPFLPLRSFSLVAWPCPVPSLTQPTHSQGMSGFPGGSDGKACSHNAGDPGSIPGSGKSPGLWRKWQPTPVFLLGKSHGQKNLGSQRVGPPDLPLEKPTCTWVTSLSLSRWWRSWVKNSPAVQGMQETRVQSLDSIPQEEEMATTPVFLPRESHDQRNLADYSPLGLRESDTAEHSSLTISKNQSNNTQC